MPRPTKIAIHPGGETSGLNSYNSEEEDLSSQHEQEYVTDDDGWEDEGGFYDQDVYPSDSASASNEVPASGPRAARAAPRRHRLTRQQTPYPPVQAPAPNPPSVDPSEDFSGHYGQAYQGQPAHRGGQFGGRGQPHPYAQSHAGHYMVGYHGGGNQMVPYGTYGPNPFSPMSNSSSGASYFGGEPRHMYDVMPYQHGYYGAPQYNLPAHMQQLHLSPPPPPATEAPAQPPTTPAPKEPPVDIEEIKREAKLAALRAHEDEQRAMDKQRERDNQIRKETEDAFLKKMEEIKKQQEEAQKEIERARAEAERAAVARVEAERKAADERARLEAEAMKRAEENAIRKFEAEIKAAEERRKREQEERVRIEEAAKLRLEAAMKAEVEAKAAAAKKAAEDAERLKAQIEAAMKAEVEAKVAAEKRAAEEAERLKQIHEDAKRRAEAEALAKVEAEKEAAKKAAEAAEAAKKEHEALKKKIQEETKAKLEEAAKKKTDQGSIKFKDAVGRKFSFPFHLCKSWQGMEELIKQAFLHVEVIGPHVQEGHFDLTGPNGEIILPSVWEKVVEPDWSINMTMWPVEKMPPLGPKLPGMPLPGGRRGQMAGMPMPPPMPGVGVGGRHAGPGMAAGMAPPPGWAPPGGRRSGHIVDDIDIVHDAPPTKASKSSKRNSAMLTFFAGKPSKKRSHRKQ